MSITAPFIINDEALNVLFRDAHTTSAFEDTSIDPEVIKSVRDLVKWGPTSMNSQPLRIIEVPKDKRSRLVPHMMGSNQAKTEKAPLAFIMAADTNFHNNLPQQFPAGGNGPRDMYENNKETRTAVALQSANLQAAYFILGLRAVGLDVGPMGGFDADAVTQEFLRDGEQAIMVIIAGVPADTDSHHPRGPRMDDADVFRIAD